MGPRGSRKIGAKPKNFGKSISKLFRSLRNYRTLILVSLILAAGGTVITILGPKLMGNIINIIVEDVIQRFTDPNYTYRYDEMGGICLLLISLYIGATVISYISGWILTGITQKVVKKFRKDISEKINRLPISYFDKHQYGDTLSRVTNDVDTIAQSLNQSLSNLISNITLFIGILVMMFTISWQLSIIALITIPISAVVVGFITKKSQGYFKSQQEELGQLNGHIEETYAGVNIIKTFSAESRTIEKFNNINTRLHSSGWKSQFISGLMYPIMNFISNLGYVGTAIVGGYLAINGRLLIGDLTAFIQYMNEFNQPITQIAQIITTLQSAVAASERVFDFLEEPEEVEVSSLPANLPDLHKGTIEFQNVKFGYEKDELVIKDFSATIKPGMTVAIVGPTGAGKTTLVNLLMRFYDPTSGTISIAGVDTTTLPRSTVRSLFGMVLQDTWLFEGSIYDNLKYGNKEATEADIKKAAETAHIARTIESLPAGYGTKIDEDSEAISAGEKQLLTIARAFVADPPMIILDEATSSVDTRTEQLIQNAMEKLTRGRTSFVIAHRLSTIKSADLILVMHEGNIIEQGTHKQLLKTDGFYASLYNSQFSDLD